MYLSSEPLSSQDVSGIRLNDQQSTQETYCETYCGANEKSIVHIMMETKRRENTRG